MDFPALKLIKWICLSEGVVMQSGQNEAQFFSELSCPPGMRRMEMREKLEDWDVDDEAESEQVFAFLPDELNNWQGLNGDPRAELKA